MSGVAEARCVACGGEELRLWARVGGQAGEQGLIPTTDRYGTALSDIVRCHDCGHGQLRRFPAAVELDSAYRGAASEDYAVESAGQLETAHRLLDRIENHVVRGDGRELLDLGCWLGYFSVAAQSRGWDTLGVEPSGFAAERARGEHGLEVLEANLDEVELEEGRFAAAFMGDVIEHLIDPAVALERIERWLDPGGVVAMTLPDAGSRIARSMGGRWWSVIPTHVQYFTRHSIGTMLDRSGFDALLVTTAPKSFSVGYYLSRLRGYSPALARAAVGLAEGASAADRQWAPDFGDRMLVVARPRR